jgi:hypothetical protein
MRPPVGNASRAFRTRFRIACSSCVGSIRTMAGAGASWQVKTMSSRISRASIDCSPPTARFRSTSFGISTCLRLNASSFCVSAAARFPAF